LMGWTPLKTCNKMASVSPIIGASEALKILRLL